MSEESMDSKTSINNADIIFPFSAVQGQPLFKLALLLATVNPLIGGVLISGPRGCAKSTLARGVADLLPINDQVAAQFVTLPLGASEEMLIGTLDLDHVLNDKKLKFSPGLLKKANGGVLYVDEVNLLPDHLVDQLLDVASSGVNVVERDGISHRHDARFTLIGTMNPDEGELRPQLQDRFGLMVELDNIYSLEERINIIKTRQRFETDKVAFHDSFQAQQILLQQQITDAQKRLPNVSCDDACFIEIATRCQQANVDGLRADIMMHRASITHAAWCGRDSVTFEDIEQVAPLVLIHRQQGEGTPPTTSSNNTPQNNAGNSDNHSEQKNENKNSQNKPRNSGGFSRPQAPANDNVNHSKQEKPDQTNESNKNPNSSEENSANASSGIGEWGAMPAGNAEKQKTNIEDNLALPNLLTNDLQSAALSNVVIKHSLTHQYAKNSNGVNKNAKGEKKSAIESNKPDWFSTISKSLGQWPPSQLAFKKEALGEQKLHLILLDTSASTLTDSLSSIAKSVVKNITDNAYLKRDKISLLGFGNDKVETIVKAGRAPKQVVTLLDNISALGGTPLRLVMQKAGQSIKQLSQQYPGISLFCYLITDGRSRVDLSDLKLSVPTLLIDIEKSVIKRGRGELLANQLQATYVATNTTTNG